MANVKKIIRDERFEIRLSKAEKDLLMNYAKDLGINPSRLARNVLMMEAESIINKFTTKPFVKAYIHYAKVTNNQEILKRLQED
jgi:hypothetical protein